MHYRNPQKIWLSCTYKNTFAILYVQRTIFYVQDNHIFCGFFMSFPELRDDVIKFRKYKREI